MLEGCLDRLDLEEPLDRVNWLEEPRFLGEGFRGGRGGVTMATSLTLLGGLSDDSDIVLSKMERLQDRDPMLVGPWGMPIGCVAEELLEMEAVWMWEGFIGM